ncbi:hypothetical protein SNE25_09060 [Mucilaginibacter sabulilitoris]|uniref:Uncharacterized protein n=1 Tax=Mucilaginibacter sabulilitoris TaxID=1173583 RepID=A0ABZ0TX12_9SPHI|nr:hypothetical protein [Mucilaginibacter sabulilitoris]WPU95665.1 hypothetical protein SNE25_09060 [Mucilaginibacter sabulilitoris]
MKKGKRASKGLPAKENALIANVQPVTVAVFDDDPRALGDLLAYFNPSSGDFLVTGFDLGYPDQKIGVPERRSRL